MRQTTLAPWDKKQINNSYMAIPVDPIKDAEYLKKTAFIKFKEWKTKELYIGDIQYIKYKGFGADLDELRENGWIVEVVTNNWTKKQKLYIYHPEFRLLGRGTIEDDKKQAIPGQIIHNTKACAVTLNLDFLMQESNWKKNYSPQSMKMLQEEEDFEWIIDSKNLSTLLQSIADYQKEELQTIKERTPLTRISAEILDFEEVKKLIA